MRIIGSVLIVLILAFSPLLMGTNVFSQKVSLDTWQLDSPILHKTSKKIEDIDTIEIISF